MAATAYQEIKSNLRELYLEDNRPWLVGFSGGKDSTMLASLVFGAILSVPPEQRQKPVTVLCTDTRVEIPAIAESVESTLDRMRRCSQEHNLNIKAQLLKPPPEQSFWVNIIGRGYPPPNRVFRWCTQRLKIESAARAQRLARHEAGGSAGARLTPHTDLPSCFVFCPIKELTTAEVWIALLNSRPPWGGTYQEIAALYQNANGGECPFVLGQDDAPSCGTSSARFGCWTCTVVEKDNSLAGLLGAGFEHLEPLAEFRALLRQVSDDPDCRSKVRRNGQPGLGPLTNASRRRPQRNSRPPPTAPPWRPDRSKDPARPPQSPATGTTIARRWAAP